MKRLSLIALSFATPLAVMGQVVFSDNFTTDSSLGSEWFNLNSSANCSATWSAGGLALNTSAGTGKINEEFAVFAGSPIVLADAGQFITLTVTYNSANASGNNGYLLAGLFNSQGTVATANLGNTTVDQANSTYDDTGYAGLMGFSTYANGTTKFYQRTSVAGTLGNNELAYYSTGASGTFSQVQGGLATSLNGTMVNGTTYVLTYTVAKTGSGDTITAVIKDTNGVQLGNDNWTVTDSSGLYNSFDELDFGWYGKNGTSPAINGNIIDVTVSVPEPATFALAGLGMLGLFIVRRVRR